VRNAKDRFPNLSLLWVLVLFRFLDRAILERHGRFFGARDQSGFRLLAGQLLGFVLIFGLVHLVIHRCGLYKGM